MRGISVSSATRSARRLVLAGGAVVALLVPAAPASASCSPDAIGVAHSDQTATVATPPACPPAYGEPAGAGTGRKVG
jgi:hypothetical protein